MDNAKQVPGTFGFLIAPEPNPGRHADDLRTIGGSLAGLGRASNRILSLGTLGTCFTFTSLGIRGGPSGLARRLLDRATSGGAGRIPNTWRSGAGRIWT